MCESWVLCPLIGHGIQKRMHPRLYRAVTIRSAWRRRFWLPKKGSNCTQSLAYGERFYRKPGHGEQFWAGITLLAYHHLPSTSWRGSLTFICVQSKWLPSNCGFSQGWRNGRRQASPENTNIGGAGLLEAEQRGFLPDIGASTGMNHGND